MTDDARDAIMQATYEALCAEGYSDLTAQAIADRTERSKASLFYHFESLDDLLAAFIDYLLEGYERRVEKLADYPPEERLAAYVEWWFDVSPADQTGYHTAMLELRAQAPYNETFRAQLRAIDAALRTTLTDILAEGIETGAFRNHDPEAVADFLLAAFDGARIRRLTLGLESPSEHAYEATLSYLRTEVLAPGTAYPTEPSVAFPSDDRLSNDAPAGGGENTTGDDAGAAIEENAEIATEDSTDATTGGEDA